MVTFAMRMTPWAANRTPKEKRMNILVLFYSTYGHVYQMALEGVRGAQEVAGSEVMLRRVPETLPVEVLEKMGAVEAQKAFADVPVATTDDLVAADGVLFGAPTRFGAMAAQMKQFLDATGSLWAGGKLIGKVGGVFTSTATQHGGQESTILGFHTVLLHHGFIIVGLPYSFAGQMDIQSINGGSPYGASTIAGGQGERLPSQIDRDGVRFLGRRVAQIAGRVAG